MTAFADPAPGSIRRWVILVVGSMNFIMSMFFRSSTAVISPALVEELGFTNSQLGDLSAAFFYAFAAGQVPIGISLDRLGPRLTICILAVVGISGGVLFGLGTTSAHLILGRILLGIGMGGNLMTLMALMTVWFPVDRFASLSGLAVCAGMVGSLMATTPLTVLSMWLGWRMAFLALVVLNAAIVASFVLVIRDRPEGQIRPSHKRQPIAAGLFRLFRMYSFWAISMSNFVRYGFIAALQSLWLVPYFVFGLGVGEIAASNILLALTIGYMVGLPLSGALSDRVFHSRKRVVLCAQALLCILTTSALLLTGSTPYWVMLFLFSVFGFAGAPGQVTYAHMKELIPQSMTAQGITSVNLFTMLGAGLMTHLLGFAIGSDPKALSGSDAFSGVWYIGALALGISCVLYAFVPDSRALTGTTRADLGSHK
ncbi:MAG: MFS transporter [Desulfomonile sp.]|nr:MFS transporter [Desulfomonile sp.]